MSPKTDPAREIADLCKLLANPSDKAGDRHIADALGVEPWSREFYEIIFSIQERLDLINDVANGLPIDDDQKVDIEGHIKRIRKAFSRESLVKNWNTGGLGASLLSGGDVAAISALSGQIRQKISYPKLSEEDVKAIVETIDTVLSWLQDVQLNEKDFIREALIDGLKLAKLRIGRIRWLGWSYSVSSLKEVVAAYMALERGFPDPSSNPVAGAIEKKVQGLLALIWEKTGAATEVRDRVDLALELYGVFAVVRDSGIAGLLTSS